MKTALFTLDNLYWWTQIAVYAAGVAALITGKMVNDRQSKTNTNLETKLGEQRERAAQAELQIEKLRKANLTLEAAISDRTFKDQGGAASRLRKFANTKVAIPYTQTDEAQRTAGQIVWVLQRSGWSVQPRASVPAQATLFSEGVTVTSSDASLSEARAALVDELNKTGITATSTTNNRMPAGMIVVLVGVKPNPLQEKFVQDAMEAVAQRPELGILESGNFSNVP